MDDARLNQILEETMSLLGNQFPGLMDQLQYPPPLSLNIATSMAFDVSNSSHAPSHASSSSYLSSSHPEEEEFHRQFNDIDISNGTTSSSFVHALNLRRYQLLETLSSNWYKHGREYHDIMYQMNCISHELMQNIINETRRVPVNSLQSNLIYPNIYGTRNHNPFVVGRGLDVRVGSYPITTSILDRSIPLFEPPHPIDNSDVSSYPNIRQILSATDIFTYYPETYSDRNELSCPITLEEFEVGEELSRIRFCRHVFKWKYLQEWFCTNSHCPVCRYDIRTNISATPSPAV